MLFVTLYTLGLALLLLFHSRKSQLKLHYGSESPKKIFNEADIPVSDEPQDGHLEDCGHWWLLDWNFLALHPHRLAAELLGELGQLGAGLVEPSVAVTSHPLCGLCCRLWIVRIHWRIQKFTNPTGDQLLLFAVLACHILNLWTCKQLLTIL